MRIRNITIALLAAFYTASYTASPSALIIYDIDATSTFTLLDAGGLGITYLAEDEPTLSSATGSATVAIDEDARDIGPPRAPIPLETSFVFDEDSSIFIDSHASGTADGPGGVSMAEIFNSVFITLVNDTTDPLTAIFEFSYSWLGSVIRSDTGAESGFVSAFFHLDGFAPSGSETLAIDEDPFDAVGPVAEPDWLVNPISALPSGGFDLITSLGGSATVLAYVTVPGESTDSFQVITDAVGSAVHVPEPASALMLSTGLLLLLRRRRSRL